MMSARDATPAAVSSTFDAMPQLERSERRLHRSLIEAVVATGSIPSMSELAARLETSEEALRAGLATLAAADYLSLNEGGEVSCLYPFSATPTPHVVVIDGQPRYAMCAIDALGIPAMLGQELGVADACAVCNAPITVKIAPGAVMSTEPVTAMVVARRDESEPAFAACCPFTVFVCGQPHAEQFMRRIPGTHALPLAEALTEAEKIFADLLAEDLPAHRPRGKRWEAAMTEPSTTEPEDILLSMITCPHCGHQRTETMPESSCVIFYQCQGCGIMLGPAHGDCCVYCTYGSVPCPPIQRQRGFAPPA